MNCKKCNAWNNDPTGNCRICDQPLNRHSQSDAADCSPSYSARFRIGQDVVEIRVPTGDMDNPHCWHGLDLDAAKQLRDELCKSIDTLEAFQNLRKEIPENTQAEARAAQNTNHDKSR